MIDFKEITFVVQGPVHHGPAFSTSSVTASIRKHFPGSPIILSTWENSNIDGIDADLIVLNIDPGTIICRPVNINVNRQIVSTKSGLDRVRTKWAVKMRSDTPCASSNIAQLLEVLKPADYFDHFVLTTEKFTRDPFLGDYLYHPSDIFFAGLASDLAGLYDIPLAKREDVISETDQHFAGPEQYIWMKYLNLPMNPSLLKRNIGNSYQSETTIHNSFLILHEDTLGLVLPEKLKYGYMYQETHFEAVSRALYNVESPRMRNFLLFERLLATPKPYPD